MLLSTLSDLPGTVAGVISQLDTENPVLLGVIYGLVVLWLVLTLPRP
ncbi:MULTISPECIES: hypothetical protein [Enterobacteriaceae]|nr:MULTISPECIES: hypothetical protein [Enterobacteriaceae]EDN8389122.1 hypothetical protein [Salmonella enterica subsp. enterica serovar Wandsworth]EEJ2306687.1 hypothetical protein [Salmonella enterica subsp. enterica]EGI6307218.1 hypothetical protein [Salmonella enterica subsp. enterica serovar Hindmarsh]MBN6133332.1 hypothetical protein [Escherichia coli]MBN6453731.1 hypothetical protein [Escherichia coli]